jgi:hypothetical protein
LTSTCCDLSLTVPRHYAANRPAYSALAVLALDGARAQVPEVSLDKHIPHDTKLFANIDSYRFFNFPTCSDVQIVFPPHSYAQNMAVMESSGIQRVPHGDAAVIHAHRFILAAGSEYFSRKLQEPEYMVCCRATLNWYLHLLIVL